MEHLDSGPKSKYTVASIDKLLFRELHKMHSTLINTG